MPDLTLEQCLDRLCQLEPVMFVREKPPFSRTSVCNVWFAMEDERKLLMDIFGEIKATPLRDALEYFCDSKSWRVWTASLDRDTNYGHDVTIIFEQGGSKEINAYAETRELALARAVVKALEVIHAS
jgi:hypothetical protein